jgi:hypothetical protein
MTLTLPHHICLHARPRGAKTDTKQHMLTSSTACQATSCSAAEPCMVLGCCKLAYPDPKHHIAILTALTLLMPPSEAPC